MAKRALRIVVTGLMAVAGLDAQQQRTAHVNLYFPQIADGGPKTAGWQTTLTFMNMSYADATVSVSFYTSGGTPWNIDFGSGARSTHQFRVESMGTFQMGSRMASPTIQSGWAVAKSNVAVSGIASFRQYVNGEAKQEVTTPSTLPTRHYDSFANKDLGVAIANPGQVPITVELNVATKEGSPYRARASIEIPAMGQSVFNLGDKLPVLSSGYGSIELSSFDSPEAQFVAWTMNADASGTVASLPDGSTEFPRSQRDRIELVLARMLGDLEGWPGERPRAEMLTEPGIKAYIKDNSTLTISLGVADLANDSDSELSAIIGHLLGHLLQNLWGGATTFNSDRELDADAWSVFLLVNGTYDPYALVGMMGRLHMATGPMGLDAQMENESAAQQHLSLDKRQENALQAIRTICNLDEDMRIACQMYRQGYHPYLPPGAPMAKPSPAAKQFEMLLSRQASRRQTR